MKLFGRKFNQAGSAPGTLAVTEGTAENASFRVLRYTLDELDEREPASAAEILPLLDLPGLVWVDVVGLFDVPALETLGERLGLHSLALEDVLHAGQRPKVEDFEGHAFVVLKQLRLREGHLQSEQVSLFFGESFVLTIQETPQDDWEPVRQRIRAGRQRIRGGGADYLAYALIDAIIDSFFPLLEDYGDRIEELQEALLDRPDQGALEQIHGITRELILVRRAAWPHREVANSLERSESGLVKENTRVFLRDCYDHTVQILDILESYRDLARGLMDLYLSTVSNRMNEVMKVLTIMASIFIPLTFLAGIYGMNFDPDAGPWNMPELRWSWGYPAFWVVILGMGAGMVVFFKRRNWW
jgi:magnesium transporter